MTPRRHRARTSIVFARSSSSLPYPRFLASQSPVSSSSYVRPEAVAREFKRIAYTGTMCWRRQIRRPAHEVALGIWLASLV